MWNFTCFEQFQVIPIKTAKDLLHINIHKTYKNLLNSLTQLISMNTYYFLSYNLELFKTNGMVCIITADDCIQLLTILVITDILANTLQNQIKTNRNLNSHWKLVQYWKIRIEIARLIFQLQREATHFKLTISVRINPTSLWDRNQIIYLSQSQIVSKPPG